MFLPALTDQPEYLHVLVQPMLTHALPLAVVLLLLAVVLRHRRAQIVGLTAVFLSSLAVIPAVHSGKGGFDRMLAASDLTGGEWLEIHRYRAEHWYWVFGLVALLALASLLALWLKPRLSRWLVGVTLLASLAACAVAVYIAWPGGKVRHREFRDDPPPQAELDRIEAAQKKDGQE